MHHYRANLRHLLDFFGFSHGPCHLTSWAKPVSSSSSSSSDNSESEGSPAIVVSALQRGLDEALVQVKAASRCGIEIPVLKALEALEV